MAGEGLRSEYAFLVIGAGPAGMAAATLAAELGVPTLLLDEQEGPGGQIYRGIERLQRERPGALSYLGPETGAGAELARKLRAARLDYLPGVGVWNLSRELSVSFSHEGRSREVRCAHLLLATGALERPVPIPGWTLPGVMTAGGLQILLKSAGLAPSGRFLLAGSGPLLLLLADQCIKAGRKPAAIVETLDWRARLAALPFLPQALPARDILRRGLAMLRRIRAAGVPFHGGASGLKVEGEERAEALSFTARGREQRIAAEIIALHQGVVPNQQATRLLDCDHLWDARQRCFRPRLDEWFMTSLDRVFVAGDGAGIGGAKAAEQRGRLVALSVACRLGFLSEAERDRRAAPERRAHALDQSVRPFLEALYAPPQEILAPDDAVTICRCEEVTAGALRRAVQLGCSGPNQAKSFLRCGMGPCQGRLCGLTVTEIIAAERQVSHQEVGYYRVRPPMKPLRLGELAALDEVVGEGVP